jgi:hypothetical protein
MRDRGDDNDRHSPGIRSAPKAAQHECPLQNVDYIDAD